MSMRPLALVLLFLILALPAAAARIVPDEGRVADDEARLTLARLLGEEGMDAEALAQAHALRAAGKSGPAVDFLEARALTRLGRAAEAAPLLGRLAASARTPEDMADLADLELGLGHAVRGGDLYERALAALPGDPVRRREMRLRHASRMSAWGAFDRGARIVREECGRIPEDRDTVLVLAGLLDGGQRREEARALLSRLLVLDPSDAEARLALARSLLDSGDFDRAAEALAPLSADERAAPLLQLAGSRRFGANATGVEKTAAASASTAPAGLMSRGRVMSGQGRHAEAEGFYRAALKMDSENFEASMALADALAAQNRLDEAVALCDEMLAGLPDSSRTALSRARFLGWAGRYDESVAAYRSILAEAPDNGAARRELARTLYWAKRGDEGDAVYAEIWRPAVDEKLAAALAVRGETVPRGGTEPFDAYARYAASAPVAESDRLLLADLSGDFALQRAAWLERDLKRLGYETRFSRAVASADALLAVEPGNQEARFDRAQALCSLGLREEEKAAYAELLDMDSSHSLAALALRRAKARTAPLLETRASVWHEDGRGELSKMIRLHSEARYTHTLSDSLALYAAQGIWGEIPTRHGGDATAEGQTLGARAVFTDWLRGEAEWTYKYYDREDYGGRGLGKAQLAADLADWATVTLGWSKVEEITNAFALKNRIMSDRMEGKVFSRLTRDLEAEFTAERIDYNDSNEGWRQRLMAAYRLTDHPDELKLVVAGEHRHTQRKSEFFTGPDGFSTTGIEHPYWTPKNYYEFETGLRWRQDLSERQFCGNLERYWGVGAYTGTDTDKNPLFKLEAEARWEFTDAWALWAKGLFHRSRQWDAEGGWIGLEYRFGTGGGR